jgi:hypothetical protein
LNQSAQKYRKSNGGTTPNGLRNSRGSIPLADMRQKYGTEERFFSQPRDTAPYMSSN